MTDPGPVLDVSELRKSFASEDGTVVAVDGVSFQVAAGDFISVHGPSGCGKSTLLLMCGGLLSPDGGSVRINGVDPYTLPPNRRAALRAESVGFVFQQFHLIPYLDVLDNVLAGELAHTGRDLRDRARELLDRFQLGERLTHRPSALSAGEQQRVALARAMASDPALILADEPTGNLDPGNAEIILSALADFARSGGAVCMVTHDEAARAATDRSIRLERGRVALPETL